MKKTPYSIKFLTEADTDFDKAYHYYFMKSPKIADAFFVKINQSLKLISKNPQIFPLVHKDIRKHVPQIP